MLVSVPVEATVVVEAVCELAAIHCTMTMIHRLH